MIVGDIQSLAIGSSTLSLFTNENGGIIDDTVINRKKESELYVVSNAGCSEKDLAHIRKNLISFQNKGGDVDIQVLDRALIALQGPKAMSVIEILSGEKLSLFGFMSARTMKLAGIEVLISRCGYTGEDGFEVRTPMTINPKYCLDFRC